MKKLKRAMKSLLLCLLLMSVSSAPILASEIQENANLLSKHHALQLAEEYAEKVDMYLNENDQLYPMNTNGDMNRVSKIRELYDKDDNVVAYLIFTSNGYIVITTNPTNPKVLESMESEDVKIDLQNKLSTGKKLYYFFPLKILTQEEKDQYVKEHMDKNREIISDPYANTSPLSESEDRMTGMEQISATANTVIQLKRVDEFVPLWDNDGDKNYGGNQIWFKDPYNKDRGCGVVAFTNIVSYLVGKGYVGLYDGLPVNFTSYCNKMEGMAKQYLSPSIIGIAVPVDFKYGANRFFQAKGAGLTAKDFVGNVKYNVKESLQRDMPVALLIYIDGSNSKLDTHWITVTKYFQQGTTKQEFIKISTWGKPVSVDFSAMVGQGIVPGGVTIK